jgi:hypothetical protein
MPAPSTVYSLYSTVYMRQNILVISVIGDVADDMPRSVLSRFDASVSLSKTYTSVAGRRLPTGIRP